MEEIRSINKLTDKEFWFTALIISFTILTGNAGFAQSSVPEKIDVNINTNGSTASEAGWYAQPWVWVAGVALFVALIIMLTRSSRRNY